MRPGVVFGAWLILAGLGRNIIEFFRPDQPGFPGTGFSYSRLVAILMMIGGILLILIKYKVIKLGAILAGEESYRIAPPLEERLNEKNKKGENEDSIENADDE